MTAGDRAIGLYLSEQIRELIARCRSDGPANSLGHINRIEERNKALHALLMGEKPELPI